MYNYLTILEEERLFSYTDIIAKRIMNAMFYYGPRYDVRFIFRKEYNNKMGLTIQAPFKSVVEAVHEYIFSNSSEFIQPSFDDAK